jgi:hypothetical protein
MFLFIRVYTLYLLICAPDFNLGSMTTHVIRVLAILR